MEEFKIGVNNSEELDKSQPTSLDDALEVTGGRKYAILFSIKCGFVLFTGIAVSISPSYVIASAGCDLQLLPNEKGILASAQFIGMIFSSHLVGFLGDSYGRRTVSMWACFGSAITITLSSLSPNFYALFVLWMANGLMLSGVISPMYVLVGEYVPFSFRANALLIASAMAALGTAYQPGVAWGATSLDIDFYLLDSLRYRPWRLFIQCTALLPVISGFLLLSMCESPKYLLINKKHDKCLSLLQYMYEYNTDKPGTDFEVKHLSLDEGDDAKSNEKTTIIDFLKSFYVQSVSLFTPPLLIYTLMAGSLNFCVVGAYNIVYLWMPDIVNKVLLNAERFPNSEATVCQVLTSESPSWQAMSNSTQVECSDAVNSDVFIATVLLGFLQCFVFGAASSVTNLIGRKTFTVMNLSLAALCTFLLTLVTSPYTILSLMGGIIILSGSCLPILMSFTVDFFPTYIRSMGSCICMVFGRVGVAVGNPFLGYIQQVNCDAGYYTLTAIIVAICGLALLLPIKKKK